MWSGPPSRLQYLKQAAQNALRRAASQEAIRHLTTALALLKTLPDTGEQAQQELALQTALAPVLIAIKGYAAPEVQHVYNRARELCQQVGDAPQHEPDWPDRDRFVLSKGYANAALAAVLAQAEFIEDTLWSAQRGR